MLSGSKKLAYEAVTRFAGSYRDSRASPTPTGPRVRGLTRGYMPSPASRVRIATRGLVHSDGSTGSRTHPWLHAVTRFAGLYRNSDRPRVVPVCT